MKKTLIAIALVVLLPAICFAATLSFAGLDVEDYYGDRVTADIFKDYKVTMVNIFTTWCDNCMKEMPDIEKLSRNLPAGSNLIAICADAYEAPDDLDDIVDEFELNFTILKMDADAVLEIYNLIGYPTTLFVDKDGKVISDVSGARSYNEYRSTISFLLRK